MAFITLRRSRNPSSYYLVESYRDEQGRSRKRTLCYLGREQDGTDTLARALDHWQQSGSGPTRGLKSARGQRRRIVQDRIKKAGHAYRIAPAARQHAAREDERRSVRRKNTARRGPKKRSTGKPSNGCTATRRPSTPRWQSGRFASWPCVSTPTRAAATRRSSASRQPMTTLSMPGVAGQADAVAVAPRHFKEALTAKTAGNPPLPLTRPVEIVSYDTDAETEAADDRQTDPHLYQP